MRAINPLSGLQPRQAIAANVRVELARANVSGSQMAVKIGLPLSTFGRRMSGDVSFAAEEIAAIATVLEISTDALTAGVITALEPAVASAA